MARTGAMLVLFTNATAILDYALTGLCVLPLRDDVFDRADKILGLAWLPMYLAVVGTGWLNGAANLIYLSLGPELIFLLLLLEGLGRHGDAAALRTWFFTSALITIFIGILLPAAGPFALYHLKVAGATPYVAQMAALRDGAMRVIDLSDAQGLVIFPSFHAALAAICGCAAWRLRWLAWPFALLNAVIIAASPAIGGHYYVDIAAGLVVALCVLPAGRWGDVKRTVTVP
jgi:hypothetical protein